jgi:hypothetical protein
LISDLTFVDLVPRVPYTAAVSNSSKPTLVIYSRGALSLEYTVKSKVGATPSYLPFFRYGR